MNFEPPRGDDAAVQQWVRTCSSSSTTTTTTAPTCTTCRHRRRPMSRGVAYDTTTHTQGTNYDMSLNNPNTLNNLLPNTQLPAAACSCVKITSTWILKLLPYRDHVTHLQLYLRCRSNKDIPYLVDQCQRVVCLTREVLLFYYFL